MKNTKLLLLALGAALLFFVVRQVGFETIAENIFALRWKLLFLFVFYPFIYAFNTFGWAYAFPKPLPTTAKFRDLFTIRLIGESFNGLIPWAGSLGGEPIKAGLLKKKGGVPLSDSYASLLIVHTTLWTSLNAFIGVGLALTWNSAPLTPVLLKSLSIFLLALGAGAAFLFFILRAGLFTRLHDLAARFAFIRRALENKEGRFRQLDEDIRQFYAASPKRLFLSSLFNFLAWVVGVFELYWMAKILGIPIDFTQAWLFEILIQTLRILTFFVPASLGTQEGGIIYIFSQYGIAAPAALTFAILRRLREILWMGIGLSLWAWNKD